MRNIILDIEGMACGGCEKRIQNALLKVEGVKEVVANHTTGKVNLTIDDTIDEKNLKNIIFELGFKVMWKKRLKNSRFQIKYNKKIMYEFVQDFFYLLKKLVTA